MDAAHSPKSKGADSITAQLFNPAEPKKKGPTRITEVSKLLHF